MASSVRAGRSVEEMKTAARAAIDRGGDRPVNLARTILGTPETGFKEFTSSAAVADALRGIGLEVRDRVAITGLVARIEGSGPGPNIAIIGELDALPVPEHPYADHETGAAHACGHHCQTASMMAAAIGLLESGVMDSLAGSVTLMAVPAEEYVELGWRNEQRRSGRIEFLGGKPEFVRLGEFDDVDMAMMTHVMTAADTEPEPKSFLLGGTNNGMIAKFVRFHGVSAHAGGAPHRGVNALNAAHIAIAGIHAQRETYRDDDAVRIHPIITRGGAVVNAVPDDVRMEMFVRAASVEAVKDASAKVDRALRAGALAVGGSVEITTLPGYLPLRPAPSLIDLHRANAAALVGAGQIAEAGHRSSSTDMGDITQIMPGLHPWVGGATGRSAHAEDMVVHDYDLAVLSAGKAMAMTVIDLLVDGAAGASRVLSEHEPAMTRRQYLDTLRGMFSERTYTE
ncbi:MAG: amidohydrolase [Chloroflexota bacterium]